MAADVLQPKVLLVLGMHRSGTSAVTRLLNLLGAELGEPLLGAQQGVNDAGFWEHADVVELNERILAALDSCWFDHRPYPDDWWRDERFVGLRETARALLHDNFHMSPLVAIKDPRLCRTLPFWRQVLDDLTWSTGVLLVQRNPVEVAASLTRRDGFPAATSLLLWLAYTLDAEFYSRGLPRTVIAYTDVLADWRHTVERLVERLPLDWSIPVSEEVASRIDDEIRPELRHQHQTLADGDCPDVEILQSLLGKDCPDTDAMDRLRVSLRQRFRECGPPHEALYASNRALSAERQELARLGDLHAEALQVVSVRDETIAYLNQHMKELGDLYTHAESVVRERDAQMEELDDLHAHAEALKREYEARLETIRQHWSWRIVRHLPPFRNW